MDSSSSSRLIRSALGRSQSSVDFGRAPAFALAPALALALALVLGTMSAACGSDDEGVPVAPEATDLASGPTSAPADEVGPAATSEVDVSGTADVSGRVDVSGTVDDSGPPTATGDIAARLAELTGADAVTVVEDWGAFSDTDEVEATISRNLGMGENAMVLALDADDASGLPDGARFLGLSFDVDEAAPHDFVGFNRSLDEPADWSGASAVALWVDGTDAAEVNLVFQFLERSGEAWRYEGPMPNGGAGSPLVLPLDSDTFAWANWSTEENGTIDAGSIDQYGVYVGHTGPGRSGVVRLGPIALIP